MISINIVFLLALINIIFVRNTVFGGPKYDIADLIQHNNIYPFSVNDFYNGFINMGEKYEGQVLLIFNFTPMRKLNSNHNDILLLADMAKIYGSFKMVGFLSTTFTDNLEFSGKKSVSVDELKNKNIDLYLCYALNSSFTTRLWKYLELKTISDVVIKGKLHIPDLNDPYKTLDIVDDYTIFIVNNIGVPQWRFEPGWTFEEIMKALHGESPLKRDATSSSSSSSSGVKIFGTIFKNPE